MVFAQTELSNQTAQVKDPLFGISIPDVSLSHIEKAPYPVTSIGFDYDVMGHVQRILQYVATNLRRPFCRCLNPQPTDSDITHLSCVP